MVVASLAPVSTLRVPVDVGEGHALVLLPGFALSPKTYRATAELLAANCRVVVPDIYRVDGRWRYDDVVDRLSETIVQLGLDRVSVCGHSFAGGVELGYALRRPERVVELVFVDTLAVSREMPLAEEALRHPVRLLWMATPKAAISFGGTVLTHPVQVAQAAWWGFTSGRTHAAQEIAALGIPAHVLWANRDSLLSRQDGLAFARELHASFTVAKSAGSKPVDHDWIYRHPRLFVEHLDRLDLVALRSSITLDRCPSDDEPPPAG
jgi:pimeloyl-ACP methyl ester carboxylesterase